MSKFIAFVLLALPLNLHAASVAQKYEQARRIAMRDVKVRAAFDSAERKLAAKIVQVDPTLKGYAPGKPAPVLKPSPKPKLVIKPTPTPRPAVKPLVKAKPVVKPTPAPKPVVKPAPAPKPAPKIASTKHKVAPGETIESVAMLYRVGVPTLRQANPSVQGRHLQPGQKLIIPRKSTTPPYSQGIPYQKPLPKPQG
ncbi:MAG: LysM peptidoglycan-binding domain-containing protein [Chthoniobacteraceae bacterium]